MGKMFYSVVNGIQMSGDEVYQVINPANMSVAYEVSCASRKVVTAAVASARSAFSTWKKTTLNQRAQILRRAATHMIAGQGLPGDLQVSEIVELIISGMGKSIHEAEGEVFGAANILNYFADEGIKFLEDEPQKIDAAWASKTSKLVFEPLGVVCIIKPWNYSLEVPLWSIGAALLAGNAVILKPAEITSGVGCFMAECFAKAGLPNGVFNVLLGDGQVGEYLLEEKINMVAFTGSTSTGRIIQRVCGERMIKCNLELGGKDAFLVCPDADLERASDGAVWGAFTNAGQVCVSGERFYVHEAVYDEFVALVKKKTKKLKVGMGIAAEVDMGPVAFVKQYEKVKELVADAIAKGAKVIAGGKPIDRAGYFFEPTVLGNISSNMLLDQEEIFGPVMPIYKVASMDRAIAAVNSSTYGLGATIWSRDLTKAEEIARDLEVGMVWVNDINVAFPECPWVGRKASGIGVSLSNLGIREYANIKHINIDCTDEKKQPWWFPYDKDRK
ncbi:MAG: aldehyde dehydrogenase family protein [Lachnospiraceae bacterium]|nr:aldehyde dehydrogenase family protein [Lachnospiraceae bacterium]